MPRVSLKHEDAMMGGFGVQEGYFEVTKSVCAVHQFPPNSKTGKQSDPFTAIRWSLTKLNEDWTVADESEQAVLPIRLSTLDKMRPGNLNNPDDMDEEPEDLGNEVDTEGNSIYGEDGAKVSGNWGAMEESLRKCGFRANVIERSYLPDFVGMKFHLKTVDAGSYKDKNTGEEKKATNLVCDQIHTFPYESKGKAKAGAKGKAAAKSAAAPAEESNDDAKGALLEVLSDPDDGFKKVVKSGAEIKRSMFQVQLQLMLTRKKVDKGIVPAIMTLVKSDDDLVALAEESGLFAVDAEAGTITFS